MNKLETNTHTGNDSEPLRAAQPILTPTLALGIDPRSPQSMFAKFRYLLTLRTYGNDLLTRSSRGYLVFMSLIMFMVALAEGVAWGYAGSTFVAAAPLLGGVGVGCFVFMVMWSFDRSLVTADMSDAEHIRALNGIYQKDTEFTGEENKNRTNVIKTTFTFFQAHPFFIFRMVIAALSLYIAAPYVSELVFRADIQNKQNDYFQSAVNQYKTSYADTKKHELALLDTKISQTNDKLQAEISGGKNSLSGRYGRGASAIAIESEVNDLKAQYNRIDQERKSHIARIEHALEKNDFAELAALNIKVDKDSPVLRKKAVRDIQVSNPEEFDQVEWGVRALLVILATILFSMKFMQPRVLKLYYSSRLQEKWNLYCLGQFDVGLLPSERREMLLQSRDALPEEFERIIVSYMRNKARHEAQELRALTKYENDRLATEQADHAHHARLISEQTATARNQQERDFQLNQIAQAMDEIKQTEDAFLSRHAADMQQLTINEQQQMEQLHEIEKSFKTHSDRSDSKRQRISDLEDEFTETEAILMTLRLRPDSDRLEVLRSIRDFEKALIRQRERINGLGAELLGFDAEQKCAIENCTQLQEKLQRVRSRLATLQMPLDEIERTRAQLEVRRVRLAGEDGQRSSPFVAHSEEEIPFLVQQLRRRMAAHAAVA